MINMKHRYIAAFGMIGEIKTTAYSKGKTSDLPDQFNNVLHKGPEHKFQKANVIMSQN